MYYQTYYLGIIMIIFCHVKFKVVFKLSFWEYISTILIPYFVRHQTNFYLCSTFQVYLKPT